MAQLHFHYKEFTRNGFLATTSTKMTKAQLIVKWPTLWNMISCSNTWTPTLWRNFRFKVPRIRTLTTRWSWKIYPQSFFLTSWPTSDKDSINKIKEFSQSFNSTIMKTWTKFNFSTARRTSDSLILARSWRKLFIFPFWKWILSKKAMKISKTLN